MGGHVLGLIHTVTMLDVIDILVVAFFLNKLYQMLKNTRAASLVKGLLMLLVIMLISKCDQLDPGKIHDGGHDRPAGGVPAGTPPGLGTDRPGEALPPEHGAQ